MATLKKEKWTIHECSPFDHGWKFAQPAPTTDTRLYQLGWEGFFTYEPHYLAWPFNDGELTHGYIWKQPNNGSTFIATKKPLAGSFVSEKFTVEIDAPEHEDD